MSNVLSTGRRSPPTIGPGIGIIGCGGIVKLAHLPAYTAYGVDVVGVYDRSGGHQRDPRTVSGRRPGVREPRRAARRPADRGRRRGDPSRGASRADAARARGGKARALPEAVRARTSAPRASSWRRPSADGLRLAVNQNGRWAPAWRVATLLVERGRGRGGLSPSRISTSTASTGRSATWPDELEHFVLYDFSAHWIDITRCWLDGKEVTGVRASEYRNPGQPAESKAPWGAWMMVEYADGSSASIRGVGIETGRPGNPFWIHGDEGRFAGSVRQGRPISSSWNEGARPRASPRRRLVARRLRRRDGRALQRSRRGPRALQLGRATTCSRCS